MMKQKFLKIFTLFVFLGYFADAQLTDSLERQIFFSDKKYELQKKLLHENLDSFFYVDLDQTILFTDRGMPVAFANKDSGFAALLISYRGRANYFSGNYDKAAKDFYRSIKILESLKDWSKLAFSYNELAKLYRKTRDFDLAMENYDKSLMLFTMLKDSMGIAMVLNESGVVYEYKMEFNKALERYRSSQKIAEIRKDSLSISYSLSFIASVYTTQKKYQEAEELLLQSLKIREQLNNPMSILLVLSDLGFNAFASGNYAKAKEYLLKSNVIGERLKYDELLSNNYSELAKVAEKEGDYKKALEYFQTATNIKDSIYSLEKTKQIEELSTKYKTQKKETQILFLSQEIKRKNIIQVAGIVVVLLGTLLGFSYFRRRKLKQQAHFNLQLMNHKQQAAKSVIEAGEKEKQRIAQDLHDGVGQLMSATKMNLSAFESQMKFSNIEDKKSLEEIIKLVDTSCKEVRYVSHSMMANVLLKNSLADALQSLIDPLNNKGIAIHLFTEGIDEKIDADLEIVLYRVIQECINNVIKHAKATTLDITIIKDEKEISATIEDNGIGFKVDPLGITEGLGMQSIKARVNYLGGTVDFESTLGHGMLVAIHIPLT
jgi:signal transduction histidine kinase